MKQNKVTVRFDGQLYEKMQDNALPTSDLVRQAVRQYLENSEKNMSDDDDSYNEIYSNFYKQEVLPLKKEMSLLTDLNVILQTDKDFLKQQVTALMFAKMPLLARIQMKLLSR